MLTMVDAYNTRGETLSLPLADSSGGYVVKDVDGLDPVKASISSSPIAKVDGTQYHASRRENRNIVIKLGYDPDYTETSISELRERLYDFFMPKTYVTLRFYKDDAYFVYITGRIESCDSPMFAKEPEVVISVLCFKPDFVAPDSVVVNGNSVADATEQAVVYPGNSETGFIFRLLINRSIASFTIYNRTPSGELTSLVFNEALIAGDVIEISTVAGSKYARLTRAGSESSILWGVSSSSSWLNLFKGENNIRVLIGGAPIPFTIEYVTKYGGL